MAANFFGLSPWRRISGCELRYFIRERGNLLVIAVSVKALIAALRSCLIRSDYVFPRNFLRVLNLAPPHEQKRSRREWYCHFGRGTLAPRVSRIGGDF